MIHQTVLVDLEHGVAGRILHRCRAIRPPGRGFQDHCSSILWFDSSVVCVVVLRHGLLGFSIGLGRRGVIKGSCGLRRRVGRVLLGIGEVESESGAVDVCRHGE